jgi:hypothetical protein
VLQQHQQKPVNMAISSKGGTVQAIAFFRNWTPTPLGHEGTYLNYLLIPWSRVLQKLTVTQLVIKYPAFYEKRKFNSHVYKNPPLVSILSHKTPICAFQLSLISTRTLFSHHCLGLFCSGLSDQLSVYWDTCYMSFKFHP